MRSLIGGQRIWSELLERSSSNFAPVCLPGRDPTVVAAVKQLNQTTKARGNAFKMQLFTVESITYKNQSRKLSYQTDKEATEEMHFRNYKASETASDNVPSLLKF